MITTMSGAPSSQAMIAGMGRSFRDWGETSAHQNRFMRTSRPSPSSRWRLAISPLAALRRMIDAVRCRTAGPIAPDDPAAEAPAPAMQKICCMGNSRRLLSVPGGDCARGRVRRTSRGAIVAPFVTVCPRRSVGKPGLSPSAPRGPGDTTLQPMRSERGPTPRNPDYSSSDNVSCKDATDSPVASVAPESTHTQVAAAEHVAKKWGPVLRNML